VLTTKAGKGDRTFMLLNVVGEGGGDCSDLLADVPADNEALVQNEFGENTAAVCERPRLDGECVQAEEGVVGRTLRRGAGSVDQAVQVDPPTADGAGEPMARVPHFGMLASADLVVDTEAVEVGLGAQVEEAQMAAGDQPHQIVGGTGVLRACTPELPVTCEDRFS
jgi:hypothetical protein